MARVEMKAWKASAALTGPNGAQIVGYVWPYCLEEREDNRGEVVSHRVSDWDQAVPCAVCGRMIVHQYQVRHADGTTAAYGSEHLHQALGFPKVLSSRKVAKIEEELAKQRKEVRAFEPEIRHQAGATRAEADAKRRQWISRLPWDVEVPNYGLLHNPTTGEYLWCCIDAKARAAQALGFTEIIERGCLNLG